MLKRLMKKNWFRRVVVWLGVKYIRLVHRTTRWTTDNIEIPESYYKDGKPFIGCFWHGRMLLMPYIWNGPQQFFMLISAHGDGKLISQTISHFGIKTIAGSTTRRGADAYREMVTKLQQGNCIGITPDGPKGPRHKVGMGIVKLAQAAGVDIVPASYATTRRRFLKSWDRFLLPLPFGRGKFVWGEPLTPPKDPTDENMEDLRAKVEQGLMAAMERADAA